jgi:hypothetical protein
MPVLKGTPEQKGILAYPVLLGQRVTQAPMAPPELKGILVVRVTPELPELRDLQEQLVPLVPLDQLGPRVRLV